MLKNPINESLTTSSSSEDHDLDVMVTFFRRAGLGQETALRCANAAVRREICTQKKLLMMYSQGAVNIQELGMDKFDADAVVMELNNSTQTRQNSNNSRPLFHSQPPQPQPQPRPQATTNVTSINANVTSSDDPLSPGFSVNMCGPEICENIDVFLASWCCPCFPLAAAKASLEDRSATLFDCLLFVPNLYQVRQQLRYRLMNETANTANCEDCLVVCCCGPCALTQTVLEISKRTGRNPQIF